MSTQTLATHSRNTQTRSQYDKLCAVYDALFSALLNPGRKEVIRKVNALVPDRVLEVGVGTGLSLPLYHPGIKVTGIDISEKMLNKARRRKEKHSLDNVSLMVMDAEDLSAFPDDHFDAVVALYVVSVTQSPQRLVAELSRVCKPDGKVYILNHFSDKRFGFMNKIEQWLLPICSRIGWRSHFARTQIQFPNLRLHSVKPLNCFGYWQLHEYVQRQH